MRAAVLRETGAPLAIEELSLLPPRPGDVQVRVEAAGVCHTDYHYMVGDMRCRLPVVLGHEGAGIVEAVGDGVDSVAPGDRVALMWRPRCGHCVYCITGQPVLCTGGRVQAESGGLIDDGTTRLRKGAEEIHHFLGVSCFAEQVVVSARSVAPVPADIPPHIAAITGCAVITGVGAVLNVVGACAGRSVLVFGAGGVGLSAVMGARLAGAEPIIAVDPVAERLAMARRLGATHVLPSGDAVDQICPGGVDWAIEAVGRPETLRQAVSALRPGGTAVAIGLTRADATFEVPINEMVQRQKRIVGSLYGSANPLTDLPRIFALYRAGRLPLDELVGDRYPLDQVNTAYDALMHGALGRAVIQPR